MKQILKGRATAVSVLLFALLAFSSCEKEATPDNGNDDALIKSILAAYVDKTVVPTYKALAEAALEMRDANKALKADPTDANMKKASDAWMKARIEWELSEAFLFGPVGESALDIDGHIDSWPLELNDIKKSIAEGGTITAQQAWNMHPEVIGFHVTEYLLYRNGQSRPAGDLTSAELNYLTAATDALVWDCVLAYVAWAGEANVSQEIKTVFNENPDVVAHLNKNPDFKNFADKLKNATGYSSWENALSEIATGAADITGEVGETKIASPYANHKVEEVESWYSWHSLDDYQNNIRSVKNAYLGGLNDQTRNAASLSTYVAKADAQLDRDIKAKIEECISKIAAIGGGSKSFYEVVRDQVNKTQVDAAVEACAELETLFGRVSDL
ncbi:putative iron-regulated protein [Bacteroidales bacterium Barb6XT]|nr:putative iron-regulated protein [Bacteroidales bacterium Barb6XT]